MIVRFIDANRDAWGLSPSATPLQVAPSTYYAGPPAVVSRRPGALRDIAMMQVLMALWVTGKVYGAHKLWKAAHRPASACTISCRLMRQLDIQAASANGRRCSLQPRSRGGAGTGSR